MIHWLEIALVLGVSVASILHQQYGSSVLVDLVAPRHHPARHHLSGEAFVLVQLRVDRHVWEGMGQRRLLV